MNPIMCFLTWSQQWKFFQFDPIKVQKNESTHSLIQHVRKHLNKSVDRPDNIFMLSSIFINIFGGSCYKHAQSAAALHLKFRLTATTTAKLKSRSWHTLTWCGMIADALQVGLPPLQWHRRPRPPQKERALKNKGNKDSIKKTLVISACKTLLTINK